MSILRKAAALIAVCALACIPLLSARADVQQQRLTYEMGHVIYRASDEKETSVSVVLQDGDTTLLNSEGESIGTLKVENRVVTFVKGSSDEGMRVEVVPALSDASGGVWLRRAVDEGGTTLQLLFVTVSGNEDNTILQYHGWIDASNVINLQYVAQAVSNAPLQSRIAKLTEQLSAESAASQDSAVISPDDPDTDPINVFLSSPLMQLGIWGLIVALLIVNLVLSISKRRKKKAISAGDAEKPRSDQMVCTQKPLMETIGQDVHALSEQMVESKRNYAKLERIEADIHEIKEKMPQPEKEDWEELTEIANSALQLSNYEDWRQAFIQKGWFPQAVLSSELFAPGEYELTEFGMSQNLAAFVSRNPKYKSWIYVIPSCADRNLRSSQLDNLFQFSSDPGVSAGQYVLVEPATLHSTNGRFFKKLTPGKIFLPVRK
jgi:hypothetical protein